MKYRSLENQGLGDYYQLCDVQKAFRPRNQRILAEKPTVSRGKHKLKLPSSECKIIRMGCPFPTFCDKEYA